jgi:hypothetical protein
MARAVPKVIPVLIVSYWYFDDAIYSLLYSRDPDLWLESFYSNHDNLSLRRSDQPVFSNKSIKTWLEKSKISYMALH